MIDEINAFLEHFVPQAAANEKEFNQASWELQTVGNEEAAKKKTECEIQYFSLFKDSKAYHRIKEWEKNDQLKDPELKRQLTLLLLEFKKNSIPQDIQHAIANKESEIELCYANFRPELEGKSVSENEIREILKQELDPEKRERAWTASKLIGEVLAPQILELVILRNQAAQSIGYNDFFQMQLELQEVDEDWLFNILDELHSRSEAAYDALINEIETHQSLRFNVDRKQLGPWAWNEPFGQENPIDITELDELMKNVDICQFGLEWYRHLGFDVEPILEQSDLWERAGKNQHAFCVNMDRQSDIRILTNIKNTIKWMETFLHELGHAIYEDSYDHALPWLLRKPPHMATTEAMALIAGRQAYSPGTLTHLGFSENHPLVKKAKASLKRSQLIFSRWVLVMTHFERELYRNPHQDLNKLWWELVQKYQKITPPADRDGKNDWASKFHIGLAPVYYYSYLLGEMLASSLEEKLLKETGSPYLNSPEAGNLLKDHFFSPGCFLKWDDLIIKVTGEPLTPDAWIRQFAQTN